MGDAPRTIENLGHVKFKGHPRDGLNLSAVGVVGDLLLTAGDEDAGLQVLRRKGDHYEILPGVEVLMNDEKQEADLEGIACEGDVVYAIGSHSCRRKKPKPDRSFEENVRRVGIIEPAPASRCVLCRFRLTAEGLVSDFAETSLRGVIDGTPILRPFAGLPCKENGVDIEGLAVRDGVLAVGFRGPVLQHGLVPVLLRTFDAPEERTEVRYVNLDGRGVRDLETVEAGYLVLAGPISDIDAGFRLYLWDGRDCMPGTRGPDADAAGSVVLLGDVPAPPGAKAEGLTVESEEGGEYVVLVVFDGLPKGGALRFRIR